VAFWWASQGKNYPTAIRQGSLWTAPRINGALPLDRSLIKRIGHGDIVFHYYDGHLRAVSVVTSCWTDATRPDGYPTPHGTALNDGWLVTVEPVVTRLAIHFTRIAELLPHGSPGPLNKNGIPQQKYLSALKPDQGLSLLAEVGLTEIPGDASEELGLGAVKPDASDARGAAARRLEQAALREYLLEGKDSGLCGFCGRSLPARMLVAGHIKPRAQCTDAERWDFKSVAALVCELGCDALFEYGYIIVDQTGTIIGGVEPSHAALAEVVGELVGLPCLAYTRERAAAFRAHHDAIVITAQ
jgi:hypothetical protein